VQPVQSVWIRGPTSRWLVGKWNNQCVSFHVVRSGSGLLHEKVGSRSMCNLDRRTLRSRRQVRKIWLELLSIPRCCWLMHMTKGPKYDDDNGSRVVRITESIVHTWQQICIHGHGPVFGYDRELTASWAYRAATSCSMPSFSKFLHPSPVHKLTCVPHSRFRTESTEKHASVTRSMEFLGYMV
jgi:hypothetical protein